MEHTPAEIEQILEQVRASLLRWDKKDELGEVVIMRGGNQLIVEERPIHRPHKAIRRAMPRQSYIEKVTQK